LSESERLKMDRAPLHRTPRRWACWTIDNNSDNNPERHKWTQEDTLSSKRR